MSLAALQGEFRAWLETGSDEASARFDANAQAGLLVYQNNYRAALMACLEESFPCTAQWLGPAAFRAAGACHVDACPPDSWSLDHYTAGFPAALAAQWREDPEVGELAALEQALADAFVGRDAEGFEPSRLPHVDWDHAVLRWVPTARLLVMHTNAPAIWSALSAAAEPPLPCRLPAPSTVLVWRHGHVSCFRSLDPLEDEIAASIFGGMGFAEICARLVTALGEADGVQTAGTWLGRWVADGALDGAGLA